MTIKDYLGIVRQRIWLALITVALTTSTAVILSLRQPPEYVATSRLLVVPLALGTEAGDTLVRTFQFQRGVATEAELVRSAVVAQRVIERLRLSVHAGELIDRLQIVQLPFAEVLLITAKAPSARLASALANAFPEEYIVLRRQQAVEEAQQQTGDIGKRITFQLRRLSELDAQLNNIPVGSTNYELVKFERDRVVGLLANLEATRQALIDRTGLQERGVGKIIQRASTPTKQSTADPIRSAVLGLIIGLPLALGLALLMDSMGDTMRSKEEAERIIGVEALGLIPLTPEWRRNSAYLVSREAPYSAAAEAYRTLRINLESRAISSKKRHLLFTSAGIGEGKTVTTANLGVAFGEAGRAVLLVSADLRHPRLHEFFDADVSPGLTELLRGEVEAGASAREISPNLYLLPSGSPEKRPDQLPTIVSFREALDQITVSRSTSQTVRSTNGHGGSHGNGPGDGSPGRKGRKASSKVSLQPGVVLLDAPPVLGAAEVSSLVSTVDGVVMVVQVGVTRRQAALRAAEQIRRAGGTIIGVVLIGVRGEAESLYPAYHPHVMRSGDSTWSRVVGSLKQQ